MIIENENHNEVNLWNVQNSLKKKTKKLKLLCKVFTASTKKGRVVKRAKKKKTRKKIKEERDKQRKVRYALIQCYGYTVFSLFFFLLIKKQM